MRVPVSHAAASAELRGRYPMTDEPIDSAKTLKQIKGILGEIRDAQKQQLEVLEAILEAIEAARADQLGLRN